MKTKTLFTLLLFSAMVQSETVTQVRSSRPIDMAVETATILGNKIREVTKATPEKLDKAKTSVLQLKEKGEVVCQEVLTCQKLRNICNKTNLPITTEKRCKQFNNCIHQSRTDLPSHKCEYKFYPQGQFPSCLFTWNMISPGKSCPGNSSFYKSNGSRPKELDCLDFVHKFDRVSGALAAEKMTYKKYAEELKVELDKNILHASFSSDCQKIERDLPTHPKDNGEARLVEEDLPQLSKEVVQHREVKPVNGQDSSEEKKSRVISAD